MAEPKRGSFIQKVIAIKLPEKKENSGPQPKRPAPPAFKKAPVYAGTDTGEAAILDPKQPVKMIRPEDTGEIPVDVVPAAGEKPERGKKLEPGPLMALFRSAQSYRSDFDPFRFAQKIEAVFECAEGERGDRVPYKLIRTDDGKVYRLYGYTDNFASMEKWDRCKPSADIKMEGQVFSLYEEKQE